MADPWKKPCPKCNKVVTWTQKGEPRKHKCEEESQQTDQQSTQPGQPSQQTDQPAQPAQPVQQTVVTPEMVIAKYIEDRDKIASLKKEYEEKTNAIKDLQEKRERFLLGIMNRQGMEKIGTAAGTAFTDWKDSATVEGREEFLTWVADDWYKRKHYLESRVSKAAVKQAQEEGELTPPGVTYKKWKGIKIRRS